MGRSQNTRAEARLATSYHWPALNDEEREKLAVMLEDVGCTTSVEFGRLQHLLGTLEPVVMAYNRARLDCWAYETLMRVVEREAVCGLPVLPEPRS